MAIQSRRLAGVIVGTGSIQYLSRLFRLAHQLRIGRSSLWPGSIFREARYLSLLTSPV